MSGWQTIAGAADELQATAEYGFPLVYIALSNKYLLAVKCSGAVAKYIPQSSSIKILRAIKGKKNREDCGSCKPLLESFSGARLLDTPQALAHRNASSTQGLNFSASL